MVGVSGDNGAVAVVVDVGEEVSEDGAHFDRGKRGGVAALLRDAVAGAQVVPGTAREHARSLLTRRALNTLVAGAIVATAAAVFDVTVCPDAAVVDAGRGARGIA